MSKMVRETWLNTRAHHIIDRLYQADPEKWRADNGQSFMALCREKIKEVAAELPVYNDDMVNGRAVRIRAIVQNQLEDEYFRLDYEIPPVGGQPTHFPVCYRSFMDSADGRPYSGQPIRRSRYMMAPVPGASAWWDTEWAGNAETPEVMDFGNFVATVVEESFRPNSIMELYGFASKAPLDQDSEETDESLKRPIFYVIDWKPYVETIDDAAPLCSTYQEILDSAIGDPTAARFLMLNLLAKVYSRNPLPPQCTLPVTLCGVTNPKPIIDLVRSLMPRVIHLRLTSEEFSTSFASYRDYDRGIMVQGKLQCALDNTVLIIDETELPEGSVPIQGDDRTASQNKASLEQIMNSQAIDYDFSFYPVNFEVDMPIIVISHDAGRALKTPWRIPFPGEVGPLAVDDSTLRMFRKSISAAKEKLKGIEIMTEEISRGFSNMTHTHVAGGYDKVERFHHILAVCRLSVAHNGRHTITPEVWNEALALEAKCAEKFNEWNNGAADPRLVFAPTE
ncbi:unnamed protein product, partial [Mesorhabditis spiculigera]